MLRLSHERGIEREREREVADSILNATSFSLGYVLLYFFTLGTNEKQLTAVDDSFKQIKT